MFALYDNSIATDNFIDFLEKVIKSNYKKVFIIADNLRVNHAKLVKTWEEEHKKKSKYFIYHHILQSLIQMNIWIKIMKVMYIKMDC